MGKKTRRQTRRFIDGQGCLSVPISREWGWISYCRSSEVSDFPARKPDSQSKDRSKAIHPFSLRLTIEERSRLADAAGNQPIGAYIHKYTGIKTREERDRLGDDEKDLPSIEQAKDAILARMTGMLRRKIQEIETGSAPPVRFLRIPQEPDRPAAA